MTMKNQIKQANEEVNAELTMKKEMTSSTSARAMNSLGNVYNRNNLRSSPNDI